MAEEKRLRSVEICDRPLMCEEDWKDPQGAKVLGEYHKDEGMVDEKLIEEDLDAFERYWKKKESINFQTEYHKEGAPYLEAPWSFEGHQPRTSAKGGVMAEAAAATGPDGKYLVYEEEGTSPPSPAPGAARKGPELEGPAPVKATVKDQGAKAGAAPKEAGKKQVIPLSEVIDLNTIEVFSYWFFRLVFGKQVHVPIKKEGMFDMDVHVDNKDVVVNTNQIFFAFPELVVWHITYTHKGRAVVEIGRGVPNGMKVHRRNALRLGLEVWLGTRKSNKEKAAGKVAKPSAPKRPELEDKGDIT
jgi:hypothetical protein